MIEKSSISPEYIKQISTTDTMVILKEKRRIIFLCNLLLRVYAYNAISTHTVLSLSKIKTPEREMNIQSMVY